MVPSDGGSALFMDMNVIDIENEFVVVEGCYVTMKWRVDVQLWMLQRRLWHSAERKALDCMASASSERDLDSAQLKRSRHGRARASRPSLPPLTKSHSLVRLTNYILRVP